MKRNGIHSLLPAGLTFSAAAPVVFDMLDPEELTPGMKGDGRSLFAGTKPECFPVEVPGVFGTACGQQSR